ncbi:MAG: helix-turn-helix transcriptional regulator [Alphaproteobacteria bacterium]|nr:helix-turn-helix transcriptional regulator [Alphaproteobacteria bacterium]
MESTDEIRKKIKRLINERGLNYAQVSLAIGKNIAYLQQFIKNGSPRRLGEVERHKLAQILHVEEQELTDLPLPVYNGATSINAELLTAIIESVEQWILTNHRNYTAHQKAELIRFMYMKLQGDSLEVATEKMREYIEIYDELKKAN